MKIYLIGYGKMGQTIARIAASKGHEIIGYADHEHPINHEVLTKADVAIEFTRPDAAYSNIKLCLDLGIPVVSGTTGWLEQKPLLDQYCKEVNGHFLQASNFSVGVHLFLKIVQAATKLMHNHPLYKAHIEEVHHTAKLDMPSGTALLVQQAMAKSDVAYQDWFLTNDGEGKPGQLPITSIREEAVPGTHTLTFSSAIDDITLSHIAHSREGFATGAVVAAEWLVNHPGVWGMEDVLAE